MTSRIRIAVLFAGMLLLAGVARAADTSSAVPSDVEQARERSKPSVPYLDYTNCPTPQAQQEVQLKAVLQYPDEDRGPVVAKGGCAVASTEQAPSKVDDRYSIGE
jgi:hypothetical protein